MLVSLYVNTCCRSYREVHININQLTASLSTAIMIDNTSNYVRCSDKKKKKKEKGNPI